MSKEQLQGMNKNELLAKAKELGVSRYKQGKMLPKSELIEAILAVDTADGQGVTEESAEVPEEKPVEEEAGGEEEVNDMSSEERQARHIKYVENVKVGTLVAFKTAPNKAKSAKVIKRSTKNRKLKVQTQYGKEFVISFDDVIWVHTNKRWPKGVYNMLKGVTGENEGTDAENK